MGPGQILIKTNLTKVGILVCRILKRIYCHEINLKKDNILKNLKDKVHSLSKEQKKILWKASGSIGSSTIKETLNLKQ